MTYTFDLAGLEMVVCLHVARFEFLTFMSAGIMEISDSNLIMVNVLLKNTLKSSQKVGQILWVLHF